MKNIWSNLTEVCGNTINERILEQVVLTTLVKDAFNSDNKVYSIDRNGILKNTSLDDFINLCIPSGNYRIIYESEEIRIITLDQGYIGIYYHKHDRGITARLFSTNKDYISKFEKICKENILSHDEGSVHVLTSTRGGFDLMPIGIINSALVRENYESKVINSYDYVVKELNSKDPFGRLTIISGPPGTGKTYLTRGIISELKNSTIIVMPSRMVTEIDGPSLIPVFIDRKSESSGSLTFIIEDADDNLVPRGSDNMSAISSLLNYTDGIFGSMLDLRIIATTNADKLQIDSALTRAGRLLKHIVVDKLTAKTANSILNRLAEKDVANYKEETALADVYADAARHGADIKDKSEITSSYDGLYTRSIGFF